MDAVFESFVYDSGVHCTYVDDYVSAFLGCERLEATRALLIKGGNGY